MLREGDEIIVPANTFIATFLAISQNHLVLVPVEPDPVTFNIDPARVEKSIGPRTRAIMAVHLYGQLAEMQALQTLAHRYGLLLIEDAAQAHGASARGSVPVPSAMRRPSVSSRPRIWAHWAMAAQSRRRMRVWPSAFARCVTTARK